MSHMLSMSEEEDTINVKQNYQYQAAVSPQLSLISAKQTQPISNSHRNAYQSAITPKVGSRLSQKASSRIRPLLQSGSTTTIPVLPQHATIPTSTSAINASRTNFGRKRYDNANISFSFSLLSTSRRAPQSGRYALPKEHNDDNGLQQTHTLNRETQLKSLAPASLLNNVMDRFSIAVRQIRMASGILMEADCTAFPLNVKSDDTYSQDTKRPEVVRNLIHAAVPIICIRGDEDGLKSAEDLIQSTLQKAIKNGDFKGVR